MFCHAQKIPISTLLHIFKDIPEMFQENGCEVLKSQLYLSIPLTLTVNVMRSL